MDPLMQMAMLQGAGGAMQAGQKRGELTPIGNGYYTYVKNSPGKQLGNVLGGAGVGALQGAQQGALYQMQQDYSLEQMQERDRLSRGATAAQLDQTLENQLARDKWRHENPSESATMDAEYKKWLMNQKAETPSIAGSDGAGDRPTRNLGSLAKSMKMVDEFGVKDKSVLKMVEQEILNGTPIETIAEILRELTGNAQNEDPIHSLIFGSEY